MEIITEADCQGFLKDSPELDPKLRQRLQVFKILLFKDGCKASIPKNFFRNWLDQDIQNTHYGKFYIRKNSGFGADSIVKYDGNSQSLRVGRYVSGGLRLKFLLNGQHEMNTISTYMFNQHLTANLTCSPPPQYPDTILENDIWIGDEAMIMGGVHIGNGCVIGARSVLPPGMKCEAYGVYVGSPARLVRLRFHEKVVEKLLELKWWEQPIEWVKKNNSAFCQDLNALSVEEAVNLLESIKD